MCGTNIPMCERPLKCLGECRKGEGRGGVENLWGHKGRGAHMFFLSFLVKFQVSFFINNNFTNFLYIT